MHGPAACAFSRPETVRRTPVATSSVRAHPRANRRYQSPRGGMKAAKIEGIPKMAVARAITVHAASERRNRMRDILPGPGRARIAPLRRRSRYGGAGARFRRSDTQALRDARGRRAF